MKHLNALDYLPDKRIVPQGGWEDPALLTKGGWEASCPMCEDVENWNLRIYYDAYRVRLQCTSDCDPAKIFQALECPEVCWTCQRSLDWWASNRLLALAEDLLLFRDPQQKIWAVAFNDDGDEQRFRVPSVDCRIWLVGAYWHLDGSTPKKSLVTAAMDVIASRGPSAVNVDYARKMIEAFLAFARSQRVWCGAVGQLYKIVKAQYGRPTHGVDWPESVEQFRKVLDGLAPKLLTQGVAITLGKRQGGTGLHLVGVTVCDGSNSTVTSASERKSEN